MARGDVQLMMEAGVKNYSQWFAGKFNDVSDALSRDDDRTNEISSWLTLLLQKLPVKEQ